MTADELKNAMKARLSILAPDRLLVIAQAFRQGFTVEKIFQYTGIDPWFLRQIEKQKIGLKPTAYRKLKPNGARLNPKVLLMLALPS